MPIEPEADAGVDAADFPTGSEYWPCYFWEGTSETVSKCSPQCSNETLLGRLSFGEGNTCEIRPGEMCPTEFMTAPAYESGAGCCVYSTSPFERVEFLGCL